MRKHRLRPGERCRRASPDSWTGFLSCASALLCRPIRHHLCLLSTPRDTRNLAIFRDLHIYAYLAEREGLLGALRLALWAAVAFAPAFSRTSGAHIEPTLI